MPDQHHHGGVARVSLEWKDIACTKPHECDGLSRIAHHIKVSRDSERRLELISLGINDMMGCSLSILKGDLYSNSKNKPYLQQYMAHIPVPRLLS
jgi:hypothetical protein